MSVDYHRRVLSNCLTSVAKRNLSWNDVRPLIENWWQSYKLWEAKDEFNVAFRRSRMSVRTFDPNFALNVNKRLGLSDVNTFNVSAEDQRFFKDSSYGERLAGQELQDAAEKFRGHEAAARKWAAERGVPKSGAYWADRGIDSKSFADPANFVNREAKYDAGLHDLSASLLNGELTIFEQVHNNENHAHFSFVPLSEPEDQRMMFTLIRFAKTMRPYWPEMYALIMEYRGKMTRVKLAQSFDMGAGYIAIPVTNPVPGEREFKLRYGLVSKVSILAEDASNSAVTPAAAPAAVRVNSDAPPPPSGKPMKKLAKTVNLNDRSATVTPEVYQARQQAALDYRSILVRKKKNEIVIALRQHAGNFPVYAERIGDTLACYKIVGGKQVWTGYAISERGVMSFKSR
ncbi:hypothetical protein [Paraburkholderia terrae]|nr:hypothetical protein [Paraburkholderia terrae]